MMVWGEEDLRCYSYSDFLYDIQTFDLLRQEAKDAQVIPNSLM